MSPKENTKKLNHARSNNPLNPGDPESNQEAFFEIYNAFPQPAQEIVSGLSSMFLELDVYKRFRSDPENIKALETHLKALGVNDIGVDSVVNYFSLRSPVEPMPSNQ